MPGKFVVKKGTTGKFRFNLHSTNGQVVASSEAYETKRAALAGIKSVQKLAPDATIEDQTTKESSKVAAAAKLARKATGKKGSSKLSGTTDRPRAGVRPSEASMVKADKQVAAVKRETKADKKAGGDPAPISAVKDDSV